MFSSRNILSLLGIRYFYFNCLTAKKNRFWNKEEVDMSDIILDRNLFFQQELDKFPTFFHLDGEKKRAGYLVFFITHILYIFLTPIICALQGMVMSGVVFMILVLLFFMTIIVAVRYYCLVNKHNTWLFVTIGICMLYTLYMDIFNFKGFDLLDLITTVYSMLMHIWLVGAVIIRGHCMRVACARYKVVSNIEAEKNRKTLFERRRSTEEEQPDVTPSFLDDEPNWNSKVVMRKPKIFCPKCGFGLVEGENECHVCGMKVLESKPEPAS